jgi:fibronectin type III domain protein/dockerin type I repeat protein
VSRNPARFRVKAASALLFALTGIFLGAGPAWSATLIKLAWSPNTESDLKGYRLRYGTASGVYTQSTDLGKVTSYQIQGLDSTKTYYFVLHALDLAGNVSDPSNEASGQPSVVAGPPPTVTSALETATGSLYILQSGQHTVRVTGSNFQSGATVSLGSDVTAGSTSITGTSQLTVPITVSATAALGPRSLTVTNPDGGSGSKAGVLKLARPTDINRDCLIDGNDLNILARAWNTSSSDPGFIAGGDLDGDATIDGDDLAIFTEYFGLRLAVCP